VAMLPPRRRGAIGTRAARGVGAFGNVPFQCAIGFPDHPATMIPQGQVALSSACRCSCRSGTGEGPRGYGEFCSDFADGDLSTGLRP
jgi:hypothetical protein